MSKWRDRAEATSVRVDVGFMSAAPRSHFNTHTQVPVTASFHMHCLHSGVMPVTWWGPVILCENLTHCVVLDVCGNTNSSKACNVSTRVCSHDLQEVSITEPCSHQWWQTAAVWDSRFTVQTCRSHPSALSVLCRSLEELQENPSDQCASLPALHWRRSKQVTHTHTHFCLHSLNVTAFTCNVTSHWLISSAWTTLQYMYYCQSVLTQAKCRYTHTHSSSIIRIMQIWLHRKEVTKQLLWTNEQ